MIRHIASNEVSKRIDMKAGASIILLDRLAKEPLHGRTECSRNIFLVDLFGKVVWQIESDFDNDGGPFTNIIFNDGVAKGYRWDGGIYEIDLETGRATPLSLAK